MESISAGNKDNVVGWVTKGKLIEFYIGDVTTRDGDSITNCVIVWDTITETWSTRSLPWVVDCATEWTQSSKPETYIGTQSNKVLKVNSGYQYDATDIAFTLIDRPIFPEGNDTLVDFQRIRLLIENGHDLQVMYKLYYVPLEGGKWGVTDWYPLSGKADSEKVELFFSEEQPRRGCGIQFKFIQSSGIETFLLEEYILYYSNEAIR